jgi:hypothetical protein
VYKRQAFHLSKTNRKAADQKYAEADEIMTQLEAIKNAG